jgi:RNA ligase (TIGR02306 family)
MKLATIERIHSITPHPNPEVERLECGKIKEWPVVIPKGHYKDGDLVIFIQIDSIVPATPTFSFMEKQKYRVWNARFKGAPSSGLVQPLSILPPPTDGVIRPEVVGYGLTEGCDVTEWLGVTKYERPIDSSIGGDAIGGFPTNIISISDELNALSYPEALKELVGKQIYITQKFDGSSTTFIFNNGEFKACSRRQELKEGSGFPWAAANKYDLKNKLTQFGRNIAIQAEAIGPKLNGNRMELKEIELRVFRIKNLDTREIIPYYEAYNLAESFGLTWAKLIDVVNFDESVHTMDFFKELANSQVWHSNGKPAEGIVVAPTFPFFSPILGKDWSMKIINQDYKQ